MAHPRRDETRDAEPVNRPTGAHSHATLTTASTHTRRVVMAVLVPAMVATAVMLVVLWPGQVGAGAVAPPSGERAYGRVGQVVQQPCPPGQPAQPGSPARCGNAAVQIGSGPGQGQTVTVQLPQGPGAPVLHPGDEVVLIFQPGAVPGGGDYVVIDHQRGRQLLSLLGLAALVIIAFGRWRGLTALIGLAVSFLVLLVFILPAILSGQSPLLVAVVGASAIMFAVLYLTHGLSVHTSVAILGTLASLVLTGLLGALFTGLAQLTGVGSDESALLSIMRGSVDMRGLLLAGIIIGSLGVLDDVTVTQAATVAELAPTAASRLGLYRAATRIGRAHVASAVNTIVLAYAGASLPLLLLVIAGNQDVSDLLTSEFLAQEIVRSAVGTIGLVASVPITTARATLVAELRVPAAALGGRHAAH